MSKNTTCSVEGCDKPAHARGLCKSLHYTRWCRDKQNAESKQAYKLTAQENFLRYPLRVEGECYVWTEARDKKGYGRVGGYQEGTQFTHRMAMSVHLGRPLDEDEYVLHTCDNPPCNRIEHLYIGTQQKNIIDATIRDRVAFGERHWNRKLTEGEVREIRALEGTMTQKAIAEKFGIHSNSVRDIQKRRTWRRVA